MSQEAVALERVCINLFPDKRQVVLRVRRIIEQSDTGETPPVLIIVTNTRSGELSRFKKGNVLGTSDRGTEHDINELETGAIRYLFLAVEFVPLLAAQLKSTSF
jgi:hypothetical protein